MSCLLLSSACVVDGTPIYDPCFDVSECESGADACYEGICTRFCASELECPFGGGCYDVSGSAVCYERCASDLGCPGGTSCADVVGAADSICVPGVVDPGTPIYEGCGDVSACEAGADACYEGVCTRFCDSDAACPAGGGCYDVAGDFFCYEFCVRDDDCLSGTICAAVEGTPDNICIPEVNVGTAIYDTCFDVSECEPRADTCYATSVDYGDYVATNNTCTLFCNSDDDCPLGATSEPGGCYDIGGAGDFVCYERCFDDRDCPTGGWTCADVAGTGGDAVCIPI